jgi:glutamine synthetase
MESSELVAETLGEGVFDYFLRNKRAEWADYRPRSPRSSWPGTCPTL